MQYSTMAFALKVVLNKIVAQDVPDKAVRKAIGKEYRAIVERSSDIGEKNMLVVAYWLAAYFIALCRNTDSTPEENGKMLERNLRTSKLLKMMMGDAKGYFSERKMADRRAWSQQTYQHTYPNDWVVDVLEKTDDYEFGLDYTECGVCKLCRDEGCPELAQYLCALDFMLVEIMGVHLDRTTTLAQGGDKCDFRFSPMK